jgi:formate--tetrahydrofolate ligase
MNDRALRAVVTGLGGPANGVPAERGFDITVASEVMAALCLASDAADLERRLGDMVVAQTVDRAPVTARDLKADGAMAVLLGQAALPNLVQSLEGTPAFVHGGPFANIAHGCNSVIATKAALGLADIVVTEAGFGADLGAEKFFDIKCRQAGLSPAAAVVVASVRALKFNGGVARADLGAENLAALRAGCANLLRHIENVGRFGVPCVVAINRFGSDTEAELDLVREIVAEAGGEAIVCTHWANGGAGAVALAEAVVARVESGAAAFAPLYPDAMPLAEKIETVARRVYRAGAVEIPPRLRERLAAWEAAGHGHLPVCMAKTPYSFTADPAVRGAPENFTLPITDVRLSAGAGFVVMLCGDVMTMPGLPRVPAAESIRFGVDGNVEGLF